METTTISQRREKDHSLSTGSILEFERISFWQEYVSDEIIPLNIKNIRTSRPFSASIQTNQIGNLHFACVRSTSHIADRSNIKTSRKSEDFYYFCFALSGTQKILSPSLNRELVPGDWVVLNGNLPYQWHFPSNHVHLTLKIPCSKIRSRANLADRDLVQFFSGRQGPGKIVFDTVSSLWNEVNSISFRLSASMEDLIVDLLASILADCILGNTSVINNHEVSMIKIKAFIKDHLQNPDLTIDCIAENFKISKRYLYSLFTIETLTIGDYIRKLRLEKCKHNIENPLLYSRSITEICFHWGFNDFSHFSKLFKKSFGISPRECRNLSRIR